YFIFKSSSTIEITVGILMTLLFFIAYRLSFVAKNWTVYIWIGLEMIISIFMTVHFGYVYFSLFLAFFIGGIQHKIGFFIVYGIHLLTTIASINIGFFTEMELFFTQLPFIIISVIGVILLPINRYNRNNREKLEKLLEDANTKLLIIEERQRIARDLAWKVMYTAPDSAKQDIDVNHQTARTALKEVLEMVSNMRAVILEDEIIRDNNLLLAAQDEFSMSGT